MILNMWMLGQGPDGTVLAQRVLWFTAPVIVRIATWIRKTMIWSKFCLTVSTHKVVPSTMMALARDGGAHVVESLNTAVLDVEVWKCKASGLLAARTMRLSSVQQGKS